MAKVYRDVRLHYGGIFAAKSVIRGLDLYEWVGGGFKDVKNVTLESQTLDGISKLFTSHCPLDNSMSLRFFYMVGGTRFELDKDMEVEFAWAMCSQSDGDFMRNIYCVSDLIIPSPSTTISHSISMSVEEIHKTTQEELAVNSPMKRVVTSPRRSGRTPTNLGSPADNTRGATLRKTPTKKVAKQRPSTMKNEKLKCKLVIEDLTENVPTIKVPFGKDITIDSGTHNGNNTEGQILEEQGNVYVDFCAFSDMQINAPSGNALFNQILNASTVEEQLNLIAETQFHKDIEGDVNVTDDVQEDYQEEEHPGFEGDVNLEQDMAYYGDLHYEEAIENNEEKADSETTISDYNQDFQTSQPINYSQIPDISESDSDYNPEVSSEDDEFSEELDPEDVAEQEEHFLEFINMTFDMTEENPNTVREVRFEDNISLYMGQEWKTMKEAREHVRMFGIKKKFEIKFKVNNPDKLICICKVEDCPWRCYIRRANDGHTGICKSVNDDHTCQNDDGNNRNCLANSDWIASVIEDEIKRHHKSFTGKDIMKLMWHKYQVTVDYWKAWYARGKALENLYGNYETSYMRVPDLCNQILLNNPGSLVHWETDSDNKFKCCCVAFKASLDGWRRACRPIIGLDGCFLSGKYVGACLVAVGMDANNGLFPLAFFIGRKEDGENWNRFLELTSPEFKKHPLPLTVTSDRSPSLLSAIETHLGDCHQRSCFRHIFKNMSKYWRGEQLRLKAYSCAQACTKVEFDRALEKIDEAALGTSEYLLELGPELWCKAYFDKTCKSDHLTNNFTESFNNFIKKTRDKPICSMIMEVSFLIMKIMYDRKRNSADWDDEKVVPRVQKILDDYIVKEHDYLTEPSGNGNYCVRKHTGEHWTLNIFRHECSCGEWQITGIPCIHGVHLIRNNRFNLYQYCNPMLSNKSYKSAYDDNIKPIPHENEWPKGVDVVFPPIVSRAAGRPRKKRMKGHDEKNHSDFDKKGVKRCGKCSAFGHNARSCLGGPTAKQLRSSTNTAGRGSVRGSVRGGTAGLGAARGGSVRGGRAGMGAARGGAFRGGRGGRGGLGAARGEGVRGRGARRGRGVSRGGWNTAIGAFAPATSRPSVNLPPPPPLPPRRGVSRGGGNIESSTSKKRKIFHPSSVPYLP